MTSPAHTFEPPGSPVESSFSGFFLLGGRGFVKPVGSQP